MPLIKDTKEFIKKLTNSPSDENDVLEEKNDVLEEEIDVLEEKFIIKERWADLGTEEYDGSIAYQKCIRPFDEFMQYDGDIIYNSHDEFTEPTGEYYVKINDDHYEYVRREIIEKVDPGWIYNGKINVTENKTLVSYKKIQLREDYLGD